MVSHPFRAALLMGLVALPAHARDRCLLTAETWNLYEDEDGCPDGITLTVRVTHADGTPVADAVVVLAAPSGRRHVSGGIQVDMPLVVEPGVSDLDVWNGPASAPVGSGPYAVALRRLRWTWTLTSTTNRHGVATLSGLRPGATVTLSVDGTVPPDALTRVPASDTTVSLQR